jgi:hypothetical protein
MSENMKKILAEKITQFYDSDFLEGITKLVLSHSDKNLLLMVDKSLNSSYLGFHKVITSLEEEYDALNDKTTYKLSVEFDKV